MRGVWARHRESRWLTCDALYDCACAGATRYGRNPIVVCKSIQDLKLKTGTLIISYETTVFPELRSDECVDIDRVA